MTTPKTPAPAQCPDCGSHKFNVTQYVPQQQTYDSRTEEYGSYRTLDAETWDLEASCDRCGTDCTQVLIAAGHVFMMEPEWKEKT